MCLKNTTDENFTITREWLHAFKASGEQWNDRQLEALDVRKPLIKGWLTALRGRVITQEQRAIFESAGGKRIDTSDWPSLW